MTGQQGGSSPSRMGNQQGKVGKRAAVSYPFDEPEKKSRTDWTAGRVSRVAGWPRVTPVTTPYPL